MNCYFFILEKSENLLRRISISNYKNTPCKISESNVLYYNRMYKSNNFSILLENFMNIHLQINMEVPLEKANAPCIKFSFGSNIEDKAHESPYFELFFNHQQEKIVVSQGIISSSFEEKNKKQIDQLKNKKISVLNIDIINDNKYNILFIKCGTIQKTYRIKSSLSKEGFIHFSNNSQFMIRNLRYRTINKKYTENFKNRYNT